MMLWPRLRGEDGFAFTTVLLIIGVASAVIVGGSSTAASVLNKQDIDEATSHHRAVATVIRDRGIAIGGEKGQALLDRAQQMTKVANMLDDQAMDTLVTNVRNNIGDAILPPLQGGTVITLVNAAWDLKSNLELGDTAMTAWGVLDPKVDAVLAELTRARPGTDYSAPVEQAIVAAKLTAATNATNSSDPGLSPTEIDAHSAQLVIDIELGPDLFTGTGPFSNPYQVELADHIGFSPTPTSTTEAEPEGGTYSVSVEFAPDLVEGVIMSDAPVQVTVTNTGTEPLFGLWVGAQGLDEPTDLPPGGSHVFAESIGMRNPVFDEQGRLPTEECFDVEAANAAGNPISLGRHCVATRTWGCHQELVQRLYSQGKSAEEVCQMCENACP